jgi:hypothetical protein
MLRGNSARPRARTSTAPSARHILLVEDNADLAHGHYAPLMRLVAIGFRGLGCQVTCLTGLGLHADDRCRLPASCDLRRYRPTSRVLLRLVRRGLAGPPGPLGDRVRHLCVRLRALLLVREIRRDTDLLGGPAEIGVVVLSSALHPVYAAALAPLDAHWVLMRHAPTGHRARANWRRWSAAASADRIAAARERRRAAAGGRVVVAGAYRGLLESWSARAPWLTTGLVPLPVDSRVSPVPKARARRALGLPARGQVVLFFGSIHAGKSPETVWSAWCLGDRPDSILVAAGHGVRRSLDAWLERHPDGDGTRVAVLDGDVDEDTKELLFGAADLGLCSFVAQPNGASATLTDYGARAIPVCCSSGGDPAEQVRTYGLGKVFEAGSPRSLAAAVATIDCRPDRTGSRAFAHDCSEMQVACEFLRLLFPDAD